MMTANTERTVLILTAVQDETADAVATELDHKGTRTVRLDTGDFPIRMSLAAEHDGRTWHSRLWTADTEVDLNTVTSVYYRRPTRFTMPEGLSDGDSVFAAVEARLGVGGVLDSMDTLWVNRPANVAVAEYKPVGLKVAGQVGLRVPRTLVTNDHASVVKFADQVGVPLVCKTFSSLVLSEDDVPQSIYTTPVRVQDIDPTALAVTTHLIQEWVPKAYEVRVTMVGRRPYATTIRTDSDAGHVDWRSDYGSLTYEPVDPPAHITASMTRYLDVLGLHYGAFDFVVTPDGDWIMLECNPAGQWLWLEESAGLPIAAGLADLLTEGTH